jgi:hypothetical protein
MITGRAIQSEMITGRMITGRAITARIITGRIITARSPKFMNGNDDGNDILNLFGRFKKSRLSKKQSEEFELSCEDVKPQCIEGKSEVRFLPRPPKFHLLFIFTRLFKIMENFSKMIIF